MKQTTCVKEWVIEWVYRWLPIALNGLNYAWNAQWITLNR